MDDNKKRNILIIMLGVILLMLIFIIYLLISNNYRNNKEEDYDRLEIVNNNEMVEEDNSVGQEANVQDQVSDIKDKSGVNNEINNDVKNYNDEDIDDNYTEDDIVSYFKGNENEIKSSSFKEKFKDYFIEIIDFIFYDTEIKGYTFKELTNTGKLKVISAALKIDSYIEEKSPGYKDTIKSTSSRVYTNAKEKLTTLFLDISGNICKDKEDDCNKAKELFGDVKSTCKIGWSFVKSLLKNGSSKLKEWYEVYSGK